MHPVVIYALCNNTLQSFSYCLISDDLEHDTAFVYYPQSVLSENIKVSFPHLNHNEYYSNGCAAQYKTSKVFSIFHFIDLILGLKLVGHFFFATSHGKSPCDGIGGVVKRKLANASLGRPQNNQILTAKDAFLYCRENITGITFFYAHAHEAQTVRNDLKSRFEKGSTVPGTRSFHWFSSQFVGSISYKRVLNDSSISGTHYFFESPVKFSASDIKKMSYIACVYDKKWWVGLVEEVDKDNDIYVNFMYPFGPLKTFFCPAREDKCHVALSSICMILSISTTTAGRSYSFVPKDLEDIQKRYTELEIQ